MTQKEKKETVLTHILIFVIVFGYFGWFMAELDNQTLQQQLTSLKYNNETKELSHEHR
ncbi:hypothetical protein ACG9XS_15975 [Acinetobacter gyllenbergii]|uniref:hypothetical protein n=1 Tax=Acinetobacter TaxID=469 RepID=UPI0023BA45C1|nr:hypothetical protein [Acinetobacter proteolyticus]WEI18185.1 hypothetical protein PY247_18240 [Acinetobacter proteolyticus]